jgi:hypothetical protein
MKKRHSLKIKPKLNVETFKRILMGRIPVELFVLDTTKIPHDEAVVAPTPRPLLAKQPEKHSIQFDRLMQYHNSFNFIM